MDDLISRQAAIESIRECAEAAHDNHEWDMEQGYLNAIECIEEEPSAQLEIIRCKDCKHRYLDGMIWNCPFRLSGGEDFFCAYGAIDEGSGT